MVNIKTKYKKKLLTIERMIAVPANKLRMRHVETAERICNTENWIGVAWNRLRAKCTRQKGTRGYCKQRDG